MKRTRAALGLVLAFLSIAAARADQRDPRLDPLFAALARADAVTARLLEERIRAIWSEVEDPSARILLEIGSVAMANRDHRRALLAFDALVATAPDFAEGWNQRATLRWLLGDHEGAVADIRRTLALEPRHFGALAALGLILVEQGRQTAATAAFRAALALHPHLPAARYHLRHLEARSGGGTPL